MLRQVLCATKCERSEVGGSRNVQAPYDEEEGTKPLEARPEADFPTQGGIGATTPRTRRVDPPAPRCIAVPQVRQIDEAPQRNGDVAC